MDSEWQAVAAAVSERMADLAIGQRELARRAGISDTKVREVLRGQPLVRDYMRTKLSLGLGWTRDSIDRILGGKAPVVMSSASGGEAARLDAIDVRLERIEELLERLVDDDDRQGAR